MDEFYVTLLSNSSFKNFPENKTSNFSVELSRELEVDGNWKVALSEVIYQNTINNVSIKNNQISFKHIFESINIEAKQAAVCKKIITVEIDTKNYPNLWDLLREINSKVFEKLSMHLFHETELTSSGCIQVLSGVNKLEKVMKINENEITPEIRSLTDEELKLYVEQNEKGLVLIEKTSFEIKIIGRLSLQLGFTPNDNLFETRFASQKPNIHFGIPGEIYIYISIIEPQIISDSCVQVLKVIKTIENTTKHGEVVCREFLNRNYLQLIRHQIKTISVEARDSTGEFINFAFGTFLIQLHFKNFKA